jgi:NAD-reducing hydrogenase small subunit
MSFLDIDDRLLELINLVEFNKSPIDDIKTITKRCAIGIIEGGCCNHENVINLIDFRKNCDVLISMGECAVMGGMPAMRNSLTVRECFEEAYLDGPTVVNVNKDKIMPNDDDLPMLLDRVYPCHEIVKIDYFLPGCPPNADLIWNALTAILSGKEIELPYEIFKFD